MVTLYFPYRPKKNAPRTYITNDYEKAYTFAPTYGDESTGYNRHMISVVVFFYSNKLKHMLVDYAVTEMVCFDDYLDVSPHVKTMRVNGITTFPFHVAQCITFRQTKFVTATLIAEASLKSFYSKLGFKVIKDFATSPNFEEARKQFHYESGKSRSLQKPTIGLQCHITIPGRVTIIHDNRIYFNKNRDVFKDLNDVPPSDGWFPYEYIDAVVKKKVKKHKGQIAGDEMEKETKHYVEYLNHDPNWLKTMTIEIDKFLINRE